MKIKPKDGILLIKKHQKTKIKADIAIEETDNDKELLTGEVLEGSKYKGQSVIFGKYALLKLNLKGTDYFFLDEDDVIGTTDYHE